MDERDERTPGLNDDFHDMLEALLEAHVEFLLVGAHALAAHGIPRATGDIDILVRPSPENAKRVMRALRSFGAPVQAHGVTAEDFATTGAVYQVGLPPRRIDILTEITGVPYDTAWASRVRCTIAGLPLDVLGRAALITNKLATGRPKDLADVAALQASASEP